MAKIARLPDIWKTDGKADIDGVLAAGHSADELGRVFASAADPNSFVTSLPEDERKSFMSKVEKSSHPAILKELVGTVADKSAAAKLAMRVGRTGNETVARALMDRAAEMGWAFGPIRSAMNEGRRQHHEQENERRLESGELGLLYDERHRRAWFLDSDGLVEMKLDPVGRAFLTQLADNPTEGAVRAALNQYLEKARAQGTRVEPQSLVVKPTGVQVLYVASEPARVIRIAPGAVEVLPNGINPHNAFMLPSLFWKRWQYQSNIDKRAACQSLLNDVSRVWALSTPDSLLLLALALSVFLLPLLPGLGLVILAGLYGHGKTTIASALSQLLDGVPIEPVAVKEDVVLSRASQTWLLCVDEAEPDAVEKLARAINMLAKGGVGADGRASALLLLCAANLKLMPGTAQRAFILPVGREHQQAVQINDAVYLESIASRRDEYLSAVMYVLAAKVLPSVFDGTLNQIVAGLNANAADHPNRRNFHALAAAYLITDALHETAGMEVPDQLLTTWLADQARRHLELTASTSELVSALEALKAFADRMSPEQFQTVYGLKFDPVARSIQCAARELQSALRAADRTFKINTNAELTTALKANREALVHKGWLVELSAKIVHGHNIHIISFPKEAEVRVDQTSSPPNIHPT